MHSKVPEDGFPDELPHLNLKRESSKLRDTSRTAVPTSARIGNAVRNTSKKATSREHHKGGSAMKPLPPLSARQNDESVSLCPKQRALFPTVAGGSEHDRIQQHPSAKAILSQADDILKEVQKRDEYLQSLVKRFKYKDLNDPDYDAFEDERNGVFCGVSMTTARDGPPLGAFESNYDSIAAVVSGSVDPESRSLLKRMSTRILNTK